MGPLYVEARDVALDSDGDRLRIVLSEHERDQELVPPTQHDKKARNYQARNTYGKDYAEQRTDPGAPVDKRSLVELVGSSEKNPLIIQITKGKPKHMSVMITAICVSIK